MSQMKQKTLTADYETRSFLIPAYRLSAIQGRLESLSRQAEKLGLPAFRIDVGDLEYKKDSQSQRLQQFYSLTVTGGVPKIDGWRFAAKIDHQEHPDANSDHRYLNLVSGYRIEALTKNDATMFEQLAHCDPDCDHCQSRRNRKTTYLFENEVDGDLIQVGSTCVNDFAGHEDPMLLASAAQWPVVIDELRGISDEGFDLNEGLNYTGFEPDRVLAAAAAIVRHQGFWKPREQCHYGLGSAGEVEYLLGKPADYDRLVKPEDVVAAGNVMDWLRSDDFDPDGSMYLNNLSVMARTGHVPVTKIGLMASGIAAWSRQSGQATSHNDAPLANIKLGSIGDKLEVTAKVEKIIPIENFYGISHLHLLRDTETNARLTWFNSGSVTLYEGDTYVLKGTVKDHGVRDDVMQTQLTRVSSPDQKPLKHLDWGRISSDFSAEKFQKQFDKKAPQIHIRDHKGSTALHYLCQHYWVDDVDRDMAKERKNAIEWLLDRGADVQQVNLRGERPIDDLIYSRDEALVRACLERWPTCVDHLDADRVHANLIRPGDDETEVRIGQLIIEALGQRRASMIVDDSPAPGRDGSASLLSQSAADALNVPGDDDASEDDIDFEDDPTLRLA